ncbi:MAG: hypothetical protein V2A66_07605, partial [Pseudomonadota bacterium]
FVEQKLGQTPKLQQAFEKMASELATLSLIGQISDLHSASVMQGAESDFVRKKEEFFAQGRKALADEIRGLLVSGRAKSSKEAIDIIEKKAVELARRQKEEKAGRSSAAAFLNWMTGNRAGDAEVLGERFERGFSERGSAEYYSDLVVAANDELFSRMRRVADETNPARRAGILFATAQWMRGPSVRSYEAAGLIFSALLKSKGIDSEMAREVEAQRASLEGQGWHIKDSTRDLLLDVGFESTLSIIVCGAIAGAAAAASGAILRMASTALKARRYIIAGEVLANPALHQAVAFVVNAQAFTSTQFGWHKLRGQHTGSYMEESVKDILMFAAIPAGKALFEAGFAKTIRAKAEWRGFLNALKRNPEALKAFEGDSLAIFKRPAAQLSEAQRCYLIMHGGERAGYKLADLSAEAVVFMGLQSWEAAVGLSEGRPEDAWSLQNFLLNMKTLGVLKVGQKIGHAVAGHVAGKVRSHVEHARAERALNAARIAADDIVRGTPAEGTAGHEQLVDMLAGVAAFLQPGGVRNIIDTVVRGLQRLPGAQEGSLTPFGKDPLKIFRAPDGKGAGGSAAPFAAGQDNGRLSPQMRALQQKVGFTSGLLREVKAMSDEGDVVARLQSLWDREIDRVFGPEAARAFEKYKARSHLPESSSGDAPAFLISHNLRMLADSSFYLDMVHGEILAVVEQAAELAFGLDGPTNLNTFIGHISADEFDLRSRAMSTSGAQIRSLRSAVADVLAKLRADDAPLREAISRLSAGISNDFSRTIRMIDNSRYVARSLGGSAGEEVGALLYILRPSQYRDIKYFLEHTYGREGVQTLYKVARFRSFTTPWELSEGAETILKHPELVTDELRRAFVWRFMYVLGRIQNTADEFAADTFEGMQAYFSALDRLQQTLVIGDDIILKFARRVGIGFLSDFLNKDMQNQFGKLKGLWDLLNEEGRREIVAVLKGRMLSVHEKMGIALDADATAKVKALPLWKVLEELGLAQEIEPILSAAPLFKRLKELVVAAKDGKRPAKRHHPEKSGTTARPGGKTPGKQVKSKGRKGGPGSAPAGSAPPR